MKSKTAFSIIEALIAMLVLSIGMLAVTQGFHASEQQRAMNTRKMAALFAIQSVADIIATLDPVPLKTYLQKGLSTDPSIFVSKAAPNGLTLDWLENWQSVWANNISFRVDATQNGSIVSAIGNADSLTAFDFLLTIKCDFYRMPGAVPQTLTWKRRLDVR